MEGLRNEKIELSFQHVNIDIEKIVHDKAYETLLKIKELVENDSLNDFDCIEEIINVFDNIGGVRYRHDFG